MEVTPEQVEIQCLYVQCNRCNIIIHRYIRNYLHIQYSPPVVLTVTFVGVSSIHFSKAPRHLPSSTIGWLAGSIDCTTACAFNYNT